MQLLIGSWSPASISVLAALCGSLVGAVGSSVSSWIAQRHQNRQELLAKEIFHREQLYSDFISETAQVFADAVQHAFQDPSRLIPSYALLSRMRLSSSMNVIESAERVLKAILDTYSQPNLTAEEIHAWAGKRNDPLREFSNICRRDLESLGNGL
ncbi:MAG TPA: hypothetical protein VK473_13560 [Terriglobales bacterium]|nr:hypothetical protein [Terriglobales bacterium]